ncbi:MAG TPA: pyruvate ferredoxin oxidoreductase subunit gamma, partial [Candidatus Desulfaltia sp.]|nr:pyruvate ferredoxin oxidoreductase subunit gamma [Candidatus Desulfaltia sp.]
MEVRFHGRGGQGAVTGVRILATALYYEGKFTQGIPMYGTERRGAPVVSFLRVGDSRINERDLVHEPDMVVVLDPLLGRTVPVTDGLKKGGLVLINHPKSGTETGLGGKFRVATVDATKVAMEEIGRPITNTAILGAFAKVTGIVSLESIEQAIKEQWSGRIADMNIRAVRKAYDQASEPV